MEVLWVRHGESQGNVEKRIQTEDEPLTKEGILQAERLKKRLEDVSIDRVFCSPMVRCKETAKIIFGDTNVPIEECCARGCRATADGEPARLRTIADSGRCGGDEACECAES